MDRCIVCHKVEKDMDYDEFLGGSICWKCDVKREIAKL